MGGVMQRHGLALPRPLGDRRHRPGTVTEFDAGTEVRQAVGVAGTLQYTRRADSTFAREHRGSGMRKHIRRESEENKINLTPMLDVVFIMLIFFIVTATFVKEIGLDVNRPEDDKPQTVDPDKKSIVVRVTNRDRVIIAGRDVDIHAVRANIERMHAENPEAPVIIQPHPESRTDTMIQIMDSARQAGVYNVSLAATG